MNQNFYVYYYVIGWHSNSLRNNVSIYLNKKKFSLEGPLGGGGVFWNIYISMIMQSSTLKFHI